MIGGKHKKENECLNTVSQYSQETNVWRHDIARLNQARRMASGCFINNYAYVVGGFNGQDHINSIERLASSDVSSSQKNRRW